MTSRLTRRVESAIRSVVNRESRNDYGHEGVVPLDEVDRTLLALLQEDAKRPLAALGDAVHLAPSSVAERIRRMESQGVIRGYHARLDPKRVGLDLAAFIGVSLDYTRHIEAFEAVALATPEVLECHHVTGAHSLMLKVRAKNTAAMERVLARLRAIEGVARTETMVVFSTRIERTTVPTTETDPPAAATRRGSAGASAPRTDAVSAEPPQKRGSTRG